MGDVDSNLTNSVLAHLEFMAGGAENVFGRLCPHTEWHSVGTLQWELKELECTKSHGIVFR